MRFEEIALRLQANGEQRGSVTLIGSAYGIREEAFTLHQSIQDLKELLRDLESLLHRGGWAGAARNPKAPEEIGTLLFQALFPGTIRDAFLQSLARVEREPDTGLRIRLVLDPRSPGLSELAALPWELLYRPDTGDFIARNPLTPFVRYLEVPRLSAPVELTSSLKVLAVGVTPADLQLLDVDSERKELLSGWRGTSDISMEFLENPTLPQIRQKLLTDTFHAFHFIGHGQFAVDDGEGVLLFRDDEGCSLPIRGRVLAEALKSQRSLRLICLNACDTARMPHQRGLDPFSGVASALLMAGLPAVVAMQHPISDAAALRFSQSFYTALAAGLPVDAAAAEARLTIHLSFPDTWEWITPALFMSVPDGRVLLPAQGSVKPAATISTPPVVQETIRAETHGASGGITVGGVGNTVQGGVHLHITTLSEIDDLDPAAKTELLAEYEQKVRDYPENAKYHFALGLSYLDRRLYDLALASLKRALGKGLREADLYYYLALAAIGGRQPRSLGLGRIKEIESFLEAAVRQDATSPHFQALWALVKYDYYLSNGLRVPPPSIEDLLTAVKCGSLDRHEQWLIAQHVPVSKSALTQAFLQWTNSSEAN